MTKKLPKIIVLIGPTSSGKSELAVKLAKKVSGEIISADSRQVYKGMDIGTGKVEGKWVTFSRNPERAKRVAGSKKIYLYKGIPHHGIDITSPKRQYSSGNFKKYAGKIIDDIFARGKVPIICGGTGHWVDALIFDQSIPEVKPNTKLRKNLEKLSAEQLFDRLKKLDKNRAGIIDRHNRRRLIRALEIVMTTGKPIPQLKQKEKFNVEWIGIDPGKEILDKRIEKRLQQRLKQGMVKEVKKLHRQGLSWKRLEGFGLEYKFIALHLQKKLTYEEMYSQLLTAIKQYSKRQRTWWKRNKAIVWQSS